MFSQYGLMSIVSVAAGFAMIVIISWFIVQVLIARFTGERRFQMPDNSEDIKKIENSLMSMSVECECCGSRAVPIGTSGKLAVYKCRVCGMEFGREGSE